MAAAKDRGGVAAADPPPPPPLRAYRLDQIDQDDLDEFNVPTTSRDSYASYNPTVYSLMSGSDSIIPADECETEGTWKFLRSHLITHCQVPPPLAVDKLQEANIVVFIKSFLVQVFV